MTSPLILAIVALGVLGLSETRHNFTGTPTAAVLHRDVEVRAPVAHRQCPVADISQQIHLLGHAEGDVSPASISGFNLDGGENAGLFVDLQRGGIFSLAPEHPVHIAAGVTSVRQHEFDTWVLRVSDQTTPFEVKPATLSGQESSIAGLGFISPPLSLVRSLAGVERSRDGREQRQRSYDTADTPEHPSRRDSFRSGIRSLPLSAKLGGSFVLAIIAWLVQFRGIKAFVNGRGHYLHGAVLMLAGSVLLLSVVGFWWAHSH